MKVKVANIVIDRNVYVIAVKLNKMCYRTAFFAEKRLKLYLK